MNPNPPQPSREDIEARLTALLLGELPPAEAELLRYTISQDAALGKLQDRLQSTIGLVREATANSEEAAARPSAPLKLSEERRQKLLARFKTVKALEFEAETVKPRSVLSWLVPLAAVLMLSAVLAAMLLPALAAAKRKAQNITTLSRQAMLAAKAEKPPVDAPPPPVASPAPVTFAISANSPAPASAPVHIVLPVAEPESTVASAETLERERAADASDFKTTSVSGYANAGAVTFNNGLAATSPTEEVTQQNPNTLHNSVVQSIGGAYVGNGPVDAVTVAQNALTRRPQGVVQNSDGGNRSVVIAGGGGGGGGGGFGGGGRGGSFGGQGRGRAGGSSSQINGNGQVGSATFSTDPDTHITTVFSDEATTAQIRDRLDRVAGGNVSSAGGGGGYAGNTANSSVNLGWGGPASSLSGVSSATAADGPNVEQRLVTVQANFSGSYDQSATASSTASDSLVVNGTGNLNGQNKALTGEWKLSDSASAPKAETPHFSFQAGLPAATDKTAGDKVTLAVSAANFSDSSGGVVKSLNGTSQLGLADNRSRSDANGGDSWQLQSHGTPGASPASGTFLNRFARIELPASTEEAARGSVGPPAEMPSRAGIPQGQLSANSLRLNETRQMVALSPYSGTQAAAVVNNKQSYVANSVAMQFRQAANSSTAQQASVPVATAAPAPATVAAPTLGDVPLAGRMLSTQEFSRRSPSAAAGEKDRALQPAPVDAPVPQPEVATRANAFSTFSLNVSDVSFKLAAASLENGVLPPAAGIRSEEFINAFDYRDPEPPAGAPVGFAWERAADPFAHNRDLLRFAVKTAAQGRAAGRPLNLVLLLDKSGSMERADRVAIIHEALRVLATQLQAQDTLSIITFARTARLYVDGIAGSQAGPVFDKLGGITPQGGTNLEEAMRLAYQTALRHFQTNGVNRVVLMTDGAANLGNVDEQQFKTRVETNRKLGVALDCFGIGWEDYNDHLLELLSSHGDGRYGFLNTPEEAATGFATQLAGALQVAAADVKVQVEFNPDRVTAYRQIGYATHQLTKEQFRDNTVDAAVLGAAEAGNALYTIQTNPQGDGPVATVRVRFRVPGTSTVSEHSWLVPYTGPAVALDQASPAMRLAATSATFAEWLAASPFAAGVTPDDLLRYLAGVPAVYGTDPRPQTLEWMIRQAKSQAGNGSNGANGGNRSGGF